MFICIMCSYYCLYKLLKKHCVVGVSYNQREFTISGLMLGHKYTLWVSAWTTAGESPVEHEHLFKHTRETLGMKRLCPKSMCVCVCV